MFKLAKILSADRNCVRDISIDDDLMLLPGKTNFGFKFIFLSKESIKDSIFKNFPSNKAFDLTDIFEDLSNKDLLAGLEIYDRFYEIGSINGLNDTIKFLEKKEK